MPSSGYLQSIHGRSRTDGRRYTISELNATSVTLMKKYIGITALLAASLSLTALPGHAQTLTVNELLQLQQTVNNYCLGRGQGRARTLCRCAAVLVSDKVAAEGIAARQEDLEGVFDQAFESCMSNEDKSFPSITSRRYQSQPAAEEALRSAPAK